MFTLVVCSVDRFDRLARLFVSLREQNFDRFNVVLVDQNPDDRLVPIVESVRGSFEVTHIRSAKGLSLARNRGILEATGSWVAFPDDDCWYEPDTLVHVLGKIKAHPELSVITGRTLDADNIPSVSPTGEVELAISRQNYLGCGNSNAIFIRRQTLEALNGFDERLGVGATTPFQSGEEADLLLRAIDSGAGANYFPDVVVHHDQVDKIITGGHAVRAAKYGRGFGALIRKHHFGAGYVAYRIARPLASVCLAILTGRRDTARYKWAWLTGIAVGYWTWQRVSAGRPSSTVSGIQSRECRSTQSS